MKKVEKRATLTEAIIRAWERSPNHPMKGRLINLAARFIRRSIVVEFDGSLFLIRPGDYIGSRILRGLGFERLSIEVARAAMASGGTFVDIGANFGLYSIMVSKNRNVRCIGFEPDCENFYYLTQNIQLNKRKNVTAICAAISETASLVSLFKPDMDNAGAINVVVEPHVQRTMLPTALHPALVLQSTLENLGVKEIACLKMDIEGHELPALRGLNLRSTLRPGVLIVEFMRLPVEATAHDRGLLWSHLIAQGYTAFDVYGSPVRCFDTEVDYPDGNLVFRSID